MIPNYNNLLGLLSNQFSPQSKMGMVINPNAQAYGPQEFQGPPTIDQYYQGTPDLIGADFQAGQPDIYNAPVAPPMQIAQNSIPPQAIPTQQTSDSDLEGMRGILSQMQENQSPKGLLGFLKTPAATGLAQGLLQASDYSATPHNFGGILASGIGQAQAYKHADVENKVKQLSGYDALAKYKLYSSGGKGGNSVFAQVMAQINADPELSLLPAAQKIAIAQSKVGTNLIVDPKTGQINDMSGAAEGLGNLEQGKVAGGEKAKLEYAPQIAGASETAQKEADVKTAAQADLPTVIDSANMAKKYVQKAIDSPGFEANFGLVGMIPPRPGSQASDVAAILEQIKGGTFLNAYQQLRGGGQISDVEGGKAQDAVFRMQTAQSSQAFKGAAKDYFEVLDKGISRAQNKASGAVFNQNPQPAATSGGWSIKKVN